MSEMNESLRDEAWSWLKQVQTVHLATWDGDYPRVRPVSLIYEEGRFWVSTGSEDAKVSQIQDHPVFEFSLLLEGEDSKGSLRCSGKVVVVEDQETRSRISRSIPFFGQFWDTPEDPAYCLIELVAEEAEYMRPVEMTANRFSI